MFSKKKEVKKERRPRPAGSLAQYGIFEIPESLGDLGGQNIDDDDDDEDLEAELAALTAGDQPSRPAPRRSAPKPPVNLDALISESIKDIGDEELSGDDDDPDLLKELKQITGEENDLEEESLDISENTTSENAGSDTTKLLEERLSMYKIAEKKAKAENESGKARRYNRGIKTLEHLLSASKAGNAVDPSEIPPILPPSATGTAVSAPKPDETPGETPSPVTNTTLEEPQSVSEPEPEPQPESQPEPESEQTPSIQVDENTLNAVKTRQKEYKKAALAWKKSGNQEEAMKNIKIVKQFDAVIAAISQGNVVDLSDMPPTPTLPNLSVISQNPPDNGKEESENQTTTQPEVPINSPSGAVNIQSLELALKERLEVYRRSKTVAETEGNSSKVRRYGRICKQFEDALKLHARGKPVPIDELPTPPGFPPLSNGGQSGAPSETTAPSSPPELKVPKTEPVKPEQPSASKESTPVPPPRANTEKKKKLTSRVDKQIEALQQRQRELKIAALKAKKDGDLDLARDYLRQSKGIDPLLEASLSGLPVDMNSIPLSPEAKLQLQTEEEDVKLEKGTDDGFTVISSLDCSEEATGTDLQIYENLEAQLKKQIKWILTTRDHCKALGDVGSYNKWGRLALDYTKDLDMLRVRKRDNLPPPQHHYEIKTYSIVQSCTDLADADIEISIIRGINYAKEVDSYVIFEIPLPSETPSTDRTSTIRDSCNPEYNATFPLSGIIDRKSRQCQRVFKRHAIKCQVWSKGGFFRADSLIGTVNVKLQALETKCILHDSFPLMDGRKAVGGKLEIKIRLRNPILTKQIEQNTDKWLAIDH